MKRSPSFSIRMLVPFMAASTLVFGLNAAEVADATKRRVQTPRKVVPAPKIEETQKQILSADQAWSQVSGESVNIRLGPGTNFPAAGSLKAGEYVKARAKQNGWLEIDWPTSVPAWVEKESVRRNGNGSEMGVVSGRAAKVYSIGNVKGNVLAQLPKGAPVEILGEQGTWYKVKAPATATAYISARYAVTGVGKPMVQAAPVEAAAKPVTVAPKNVAVEKKIEATAPVKTEARAVLPAEKPAAPQPTAKAVLPAPVAPTAVAPEEPKAVIKPEVLKPVDALVADEPEAIPSIQEIIAAKTVAPQDETAAAKPVLPALEVETEARQSLDLGELSPLTSIDSIIQKFESAPPVQEDPAALKASPEAHQELAKAIEETRQSLKVETDGKSSIIDENLQALETARLAAEQRRRDEEAKQRESLTAALEQFGQMETKRRAEVEAPFEGKIDQRTGIFLPVEEITQPTELKRKLQDAFEADQARVALEREKTEWAAKIEASNAWRNDAGAEDISRIENEQLQVEESARIEALLAEDVERMNEETARANGVRQMIEAMETERAAKQKSAESAVPATTLFDKVDTAKPTLLQQNIAKALEGALKTSDETPAKKIEVPAVESALPLEPALPAEKIENVEQDVLKALDDARKALETSKRSDVIEPMKGKEIALPKMEGISAYKLSEEKYGVFLDPAMVPAAARKPVEEIRAVMFPEEKTEKVSPVQTIETKEPTSSLIPDIGHVVRKSIDEAAKTVPMDDVGASPVTAKPHDVWAEPGVEVIDEPEGSLAEDFVKETNKRVKSKFVVPGNAPAAFGRRAEVIRMEE